jgi:hypothetical protein
MRRFLTDLASERACRKNTKAWGTRPHEHRLSSNTDGIALGEV